MITVGVPRALPYYDCLKWIDFYRRLGANVVVSPDTTKTIVDIGVSLSVDDACLPVKVYLGHAAVLASDCDYLFVPRIVSIEKGAYMCPKFLGLPDMVKAAIGDRVRIVEPVIDLSKSRRAMLRAVIDASAPVTGNPAKALSAWRACSEPELRPDLGRISGGSGFKVRVGVLGHPYVINDKSIGMGILDKLETMGAKPVVAESVRRTGRPVPAELRIGRPIFWTHESRLYEAGILMAATRSVDGIIIVQAFGCGPGSMIFDLFVRRCRREYQVPILVLTVDEHTGEAGIVTRLEAFVDMLLRTARCCG